jgi:pilus assembly protein CpaE
MSEPSASKSSVLLPTGSISLFVKDEELKSAALSLREDWRFARVTIEVQDGDVESAIQYYSQHGSPDLVMVETLKISDGFAERLEVLGGHCAENTAAVVVGPINDVYLYRKLIEMGVSDYLVKPLSRDVLVDVFSKILIERLGAQNSKLIACIGTKGGVGTSSLSHALADIAAKNLHQKTIILDACGGWSYLSVAMGGDAVTTLHEVARAASSNDKDSFGRMIVNVNDKLSFLGTGAEALLDDLVNPEQFEIIINKLMQTYPVVIVDLSGASHDIRRNILAKANDVVMVTSPTLSSIRSARSLLQEVKSLRGDKDDKIHIVLNQKGISSGFEVSESDLTTALKIKPELTISFLPKVFCASEGQGKPISTQAGGQDIIRDILKFMEQKLGLSGDRLAVQPASPSKPGFLDGFMNKIKTK